ncbi:long-chain-fatty-acid--CoA ligase [Jongsikchunia kroppenstedtii]|uniref:long-chain-fatty-acid--CoA ligase n=1 Tax=Jongsikchunia kroppenstedtii TaxID=1121721 RepID=UPI00035E76C5|nr:long-chain-fatty-acid--CoA ligase [Jongsikchunia kroppenstedtii]
MSRTTVSQLLAPLADVDDRGLYFEDDFVSWREHLRLSAVRGAAVAARLDVDRPPHVAVLLGNIPEFSYLLAAAAMESLVLVGLNPTRRGAALTADMATADCQLVIVEDATADLLDGVTGVDVLNVDSPEWQAALDHNSDAPVRFPDTDPRQLFTLIFTSGTSGDPKAVQCDHAKFAAAGEMLSQRFGLGPADTAFLAMPMFHSNALIAGWVVAVAAGASIALRRKFSASGWLPDIRKYNATYANYVGKPLAYILATPEQPDDADNPLKIMYGNEAAPGDLSAMARRFGIRIVDGFGSTEGGVAITRTPDTPDEALGPLVAPNAILDIETGEPCPIAEFDADGRLLNESAAVGELVNTGGAGAFTGYYNNPEADAERMRGGMYHSGDLGYVDADGYVYFAGRLGDWVRVDGENMGTGPIERILMRHDGIRLSAVYGVRAEVGDDLVASLVADGLTPDDLADFLAAQPDLGPKQWPKFVRVADDLPRTETFKVLKRVLKAEGAGGPGWWQLTADRRYVPA